RACCVSPYVQPIRVTVDGAQVGSLISPPGTTFTTVSVPFTVASTGSHTIGFAGTDSADKTTFIDGVAVTGGTGGTVPTPTALASSLSPSTVGANVTFTATVTGSAPTGTVAFADGGSAINGCTAVALAGSGNTRTATCTTGALGAGTHAIVATYSGNAGNS